MKIFVSICGILLISLTTLAQDLTDYSTKLQRKAKAIQVATESGAFIRKTLEDGTIIELQDIDESGRLIYYKTLNVESAVTTGTNKLYQGSSLGLSLSGKGMTIGMWDGGSIQADHVEFAGRFQQLDNPTGKSQHSTHVLGTMLATGINPEARGMAYKAFGVVYDFNIDDPEMADAASNGLLISNHSYGEVLGWQFNPDVNGWEWQGSNDISSVEDYRFGLYNSASVSWDKISHDNPYYLIVKSAGNDRSDVGNGSGAPADGPFDIIDPQGVAKNILTVGAVLPVTNYMQPSDVKMTSFSSWGPTDDGRIKPDIVGMGSNVLSTSSSGANSYTTLSGTSMSSPNVAGSLLLLQELYNNLNGGYMLSATLKGLVIHTALESGNGNGPDYSFGWGLLSTDNAARQILLANEEDFLLEEHELLNLQSFEKDITLRQEEPASFTICWTDVPGEANGTVLDPTNLALVNDLDMRVIGPDGEIYEPWVMNPSTHNTSKGDNFRDNVEKIEFTPSVSGNYTIQVNHKETLSGAKQAFSLIASASLPSNELNTLYYIGSDGQWNKPSNWSKSLNGSSSNKVPSQKDVVIIGNAKTVILSADATCLAVATTGGQGGILNLNNHTLDVSSHITLNSASKIKNGTLRFNNPANLKASTLNVGAESLSNVTIILDAEDFTLNLNSDINVDNLEVKRGSLKMDAHNYTFNDLEFTGLMSKDWEMKDSEVDVTDHLYIENGLSMEMSNSQLIFLGTNSLFEVITPQDISFTNVMVSQNSTLTIKGDITIDELDQAGELQVNGNPVLTNWVVKNDVAFLPSTTTQAITIVESMVVDHSAKTGLITIEAPSIMNTFISDNANKFCFNGIDVSNVGIIGNTKFVVDDASVLSNADGWIQADCASVLSSDFNYKYACANGVTQFSDNSDGQPNSWQWDFGDNSEQSSDENPQHIFGAPGEYEVSLFVTASDGETSEYTKIVEVGTTTLNIPQIVENNDGLRSTSFANTYQWYYNDEPIDGANDFFIDGPLEDGIYAIEISNNNCKLRSANYLLGITAISDPESSMLNVYPNPSSGEVHISGVPNLIKSIQLVDQQGREVMEYKNISDAKWTLNLKDVNSGIYFLLVQFNDQLVVERLIKQ